MFLLRRHICVVQLKSDRHLQLGGLGIESQNSFASKRCKGQLCIPVCVETWDLWHGTAQVND